MKRIVAYAAAVLVIAFPMTAASLGLGEIELSSALNEPLDAEIELLSVGPSELEDIKVKLAASADFDRAGLDRPFWLSKLRFQVQSDPDGKPRIKITTRQPVREPFLNFLVEVDWPKGRLLREYTLLLDPPVYSAVASARVSEPAVKASPKPVTPPPAPAVEEAPPVPPPAEPERTLPPAEPSAVSPPELVSPPEPVRPPEPVSPPKPVAAPVPEVAPEPPPVAERVEPTMPMPAPVRTRAEASAERMSIGPYTYGPIRKGDTLWSIANRVRPDSVTANQMMLALLQANSEAFDSENVNTLKAGKVLRIPKLAQIQSLSRAEALEEVRRQHVAWDEYRQQIAAKAGRAPIGDVVGAPADGEVVEAEEEARLELLSAGAGESGLGGIAGGAADVSALRAELAVVMEDLDSKLQENEELTSRLEEAEELISDLQRLIQLKDDTLASLQARLGGAETAAEVPPGPTEAMPAEVAVEEMVEEHVPEVPVPETSPQPLEVVPTEPETPESMGELEPMEESLPPEEPVGVAEVKEPVSRPKPILPPPPAQQEGESFLDSLRNSLPVDPLILGGALGALLLIGTLATVLQRRRRGKSAEGMAQEEEEFVYEDEDEPSLQITEESTEPTEYMEEPVTEPEEAAPEQQRTLISETDADTEEAPKEEDPLAEVNVYMAYERFDQAEELVRQAIAQYPDRHEYKLKLLEIHHAAKNAEAFERDAVALRDIAGEDSPMMEKVAAWWNDLSPNRALFAAAAIAVAEGVEVEEEPTQVALTDEEFETTVAALRDNEAVQFEEAREQAVASEGEGDVDFDLGFGAETEAETAETGQEEVPAFDMESALDFELPADSTGSPEPQAAEPAEEVNVVDFDLGFEEAKTEEAAGEPEADAPLDFDLALGEEGPSPIETGSLDLELDTAEEDQSKPEEAGGLDLDLGFEDTVANLTRSEAEVAESTPEEAGGLDLELDFDDTVANLTRPEAEDETTGPLDFEIGPDASVTEFEDQAEGAIEEASGIEVENSAGAEADEFGGLDLGFAADEELEVAEASADSDLSLELEGAEEIALGDEEEVSLEPSLAEGAGLDLELPGETEEEQKLEFPGEMSGEIDEVGTKLDLAQAYVDMGDTEGARSILNEVLSEGSDEQKQEAQALLAKLE